MDATAACRELASRTHFGSLATLAREPAGFPFATLVAISVDGQGRPLLCLSALAEHTKNLAVDGRSSVLFCASNASDPLDGARMTVIGVCAPVPAAEIDAARAAFLAVHPAAASYASLADFAMWRLEVSGVRWIGGFGRMTWVAGADYAGAGSD